MSARTIKSFPWDIMASQRAVPMMSFPGQEKGEPLDTKYLYVTHSELNAILNYRGGSLEGAKMYVTLFPCNECAKAIIQAGIKTLVYDCDKYASHSVSPGFQENAGLRRCTLLSV